MKLASSIRETFINHVQDIFPNITVDDPLYTVIATSSILFVAGIVLVFCRFPVRAQIAHWVHNTKNTWDDALLEQGFFRRLLHLVPALFIFMLTPVLIPDDNISHGFLLKTSQIYMIYSAMMASFAFLNMVEQKYEESHLSRRASITGFVQVAKLIFAIMALLFIVSLIIDRSPLIIVSGLTALAAVLLLIFRDTILGFVSGIQIAANRMFTTGDWIQMPKYEVDGEILEIGLTNVKVQNWDKTISTLPSYSLTTEAVKNWRGMQESGGRRIKRSVLIDIQSVKLCDEAMLKRFADIRYIADYIKNKTEELRSYHHDYSIDESDLLNRRALTNIGTFRAYLEAYLSKHPYINQSMTLMVRQLPSNELGVPLELYCFCSQKEWTHYEKVQADIFDHVMAMMRVFDLRAYQRDNHLVAASDRQVSQGSEKAETKNGA